MLYIDSIWEYIVNFLELALFIIFIHKKLRIRANYKHQAVLMFLFVSFQFAVLCTLNKMGISSYSTLMSSCVLDNGYLQLFLKVIFMKIETQHILVHIIYPVNIPKVRHLIISTPYYRFSEYLRCSSIP